MSLSAAINAPILAIDFANVEKYQFDLARLVLHQRLPVLPKVPKP
jgi:hypothetical protein